MKYEKHDVTSHGVVLGDVDVIVFETVAEALEVLGEPKVVEIVNRDIKAAAMNMLGGEQTSTPR